MIAAEIGYHRRRAAMKVVAAERTAEPLIAALHRDLARLHEERAESYGKPDSPLEPRA